MRDATDPLAKEKKRCYIQRKSNKTGSRNESSRVASWYESIKVDHVIDDVVDACPRKSRPKSVRSDL